MYPVIITLFWKKCHDKRYNFFVTTYYYDRIHKCYVKELTIVAVSGSFVTGGAIRKYGGVSGRSSTSITTSWTPTFLVSMTLSVQAF